MSLVDQVRQLEQQVLERLKELEPLTREYEQLRKVAQRLGLKYSPGAAESDGEAKPSTTGRRSTAGSATRRRARTQAKRQPRESRQRGSAAATKAKGGGADATIGKQAVSRTQASGAAGPRPGQRQDEVLRLVGENPGITVREIAERLGVDATGLYRVVNRLTADRRVRKNGRQLHATDTATTAATADAAGQAPEPPADSQAEAPDASPSGERRSSPDTMGTASTTER